jgi:hypothetical protein
MTTGLSATVFLTESSIREPKDESDEEEEALAATALGRRAARERRERDSKHGREGERPRMAAGRRQRVVMSGGSGCGGGGIGISLDSSSRLPPLPPATTRSVVVGWGDFVVNGIDSLRGLGSKAQTR